ncbi:PAS domain S-box protein [Sporosarcina beigongshangi]|uniref:PAS domain S-box protein n=1 Tax=Sporosarcina beigongshangi TaxID=2782538 RepID=UPI001939C34C|nr:PAS domain S-box protein [Sporosarcina beigongshangi]
MEQSTVIHSRNKFIILFFIVGVIIHMIFVPFLHDFYETSTALFGVASIATLVIMQRLDMNPLSLRLVIIITYNLYIFFINLFLPDLSNLLYLIFPMLLTTIYNVSRINVIITAITCAQLGILFSFHHASYLSGGGAIGIFHVISICIMIAFLCLLYTFKISPQWNNMFSENKRMDTILMSKEGYLDLFFEHSEDAIVVFGLDQKIIKVNPAFEKIYGWKEIECIGQSPRLFPPSEDAKVEERTKYVLQGQSFHLLRTKEMRKGGVVFDAELTITPVYNKQHEIVAMTFISRDITLRLQAEQLLIDTEKVKAIGEIAASVAHEVRNPLTSISGFIQIINNDSANPYRTYTDVIYSEINRIDLIVSEFLVLSKPNLKKSTAFFIEQTLRDVIVMFEPEFTQRSIVCSPNIPANTVTINSNEDGMKQVFINVLKNSSEAIGKNGDITITLTRQIDSISISILDNGPGMDQMTMDNLYKPFFTTKLEGTGLGMMISKKIIADQGGTMTVSSIVGEGTETVITLPII